MAPHSAQYQGLSHLLHYAVYKLTYEIISSSDETQYYSNPRFKALLGSSPEIALWCLQARAEMRPDPFRNATRGAKRKIDEVVELDDSDDEKVEVKKPRLRPAAELLPRDPAHDRGCLWHSHAETVKCGDVGSGSGKRVKKGVKRESGVQ
jgi:hypothetical protein